MQSNAGDDLFDNILSSWPDQHTNSTWHSSNAATYDHPPFLTSQFRQHHVAGASPQLNQSHQQMLSPSMKSPTVTVGNGVSDGYGQSVSNQQPFNQGGSMVPQSFAAVSAPAAGVGASAPRQRVRARRGQATDPHSIAERLRREKIAERMKALQELVPNANKTDKASMLDEIIDYVKFLQLQTKVLSMSRLGGAAAVAPLVADISSEGRLGANRAAGSESLTTAENQVAKLMEDDMGSAMQYLQGKGLCLMPISLASAISTATCRPAPSLNQSLFPLVPNSNVTGEISPSSPNMSVLTVQSTMTNGGNADAGVLQSSYRKDS